MCVCMHTCGHAHAFICVDAERPEDGVVILLYESLAIPLLGSLSLNWEYTFSWLGWKSAGSSSSLDSAWLRAGATDVCQMPDLFHECWDLNATSHNNKANVLNCWAISSYLCPLNYTHTHTYVCVCIYMFNHIYSIMYIWTICVYIYIYMNMYTCLRYPELFCYEFMYKHRPIYTLQRSLRMFI